MTLSETRELRFGLDVACAAAGLAPSLLRAMGLPADQPVALQVNPDRSGAVLHWDGGRRAVLSGDSLAALLVGYCIRARIPVPRTAAKTIRYEPDAVILCLSLSHPALTARRRTEIVPPAPRPAPVQDPRRPMAWKRD